MIYGLFCYKLVDNKKNQYNQKLPILASPGYILTLGMYCHSFSGSNKHQVSAVQSTKNNRTTQLHFTILKHGTHIQIKYFSVSGLV